MKVISEFSKLKYQLLLNDFTESFVTVDVVNLKLTKQSHELSECYLTLKVTAGLYPTIDTKALFNLKPEIRSPIYGGNFKPYFDIQIEATLDPALLPTLAANATNAEEAAAYLEKISQEQPDHPIF